MQPIQKQFISYLVNTKDKSLLTLNNLGKAHFSECQDEFEFIRNHLNKYGVIPDRETFLGVFPQFELLDVAETPNYLIDALLKDYQTRQMAKAFNGVRDCIMNGDTDKAIETFKGIYDHMSDGVSVQAVDLLKDTSRYDSYVEKTKNLKKYYVSTGFKELDSLIGGWDRNEELAVIAGRTNTGKSYITLKMVLAAVEQGLTVGLYSGEMTPTKVGYRFDTLVSHIPNGSLTHGNSDVSFEYKRYMQSLGDKFSGSLKVLTPAMINGPAGVSALGAFIEREKLDILFVDQHSLLEDDRNARNPIDRASNVSKDLKILQVLKKIPIITVSQLNRTTTEDQLPDMSQISQSDRIGQDCTCALFIERSKKDDSVLKLHLVKSRDSVNNKCISYKVSFNKGTFEYIPDEQNDVDDAQAEQIGDRYAMSEDVGEDVF